MLRDRGALRAWVGALWVVASCSVDDHPSLGWDEMLHVALSGRAGSEESPPLGGETAPPMLLDAGGTVTGTAGTAVPPTNPDAGAPPVTPPVDAGPDTTKCPSGTYLLQLDCVSPAGNTVMTTTMLSVQPASAATGSASATGMLNYIVLGAVSTADIMGSLDCSSGALHADIVNGMFQVVGVPAASFTGKLDGTFDPSTRMLMGTWSAGTPDVATCDGMWSGTRQP